jgi:seryl-tRNA synthetase
VSVGLARLREEPDAIRKGALDKGEDPSLVDAALEADARRRALQGEGDALRAERNAASKSIGEAIKGGAKPDGPEVSGLRARSTAIGERLVAIDTELTEAEALVEDLLLRIPNPAELDIPIGGEEANVTVRTWGSCPRRAGRGRDRADAGPERHLGAPARSGTSRRPSGSSTSRAGRRSPGRASRSTRVPARRSSGP